jgi:hypothetical protein
MKLECMVKKFKTHKCAMGYNNGLCKKKLFKETQ